MKKLTTLLLLLSSLTFAGMAQASCFSNTSCGYGNVCMKPKYSVYASGSCFSRDSIPDVVKTPQKAAHEVSGCLTMNDCAFRQSCQKRDGDVRGVCVIND